MFERFTTQAREVVSRAQEEARELRHPFLGTEHLLIGMASGDGPAAQVLAAHHLSPDHLRQRLQALVDGGLDPEALATLGIDLDRVKEATEAHLGPGALDKALPPMKGGHLPVSKRGKKALELSLREALRMKSGEIGSGHLLLGLLREGGGMGVRLIRDARIDPAVLHDEVIAAIATKAA